MSRRDLEPERSIVKDFKNVSGLVGRKVRVELDIVNSTRCGSCTFDPVSKMSTNIKCPVCGGTGYTTTAKRVLLPAWISTDKKLYPKEDPGITDTHTTTLYIQRNSFYLFKNWLKRKYRIYIDNELYELADERDAGVFRTDFVAFTCLKVEGIS